MSKATDRARALLDSVEGAFPLQLNEVYDQNTMTVIGTLRRPDGFPIIAPHPESLSMLVGDRRAFEFIVQSYGVIEALLLELDGKRPESSESTPNSQ